MSEPAPQLPGSGEWPGAPRPGAVDQSILQRLGARFRAARAVCTGENFRKAWGHLLRGNPALIFVAFRNLVMARLAIFAGAEAAGESIPLIPLESGQPLVSVVIPCFNYGAFVEAAVDSVLAQTLVDVEIIVVDGGSTDGTTREFLRGMHKPRTRVFLRDGRHYVGSNRDFGIERARGRYICCLDADDTLEPTYLEKAAFLLETYGYDCVSTSIRFFGARKGTVHVLDRPDLTAMTKGNHMHTCAVFRRVLWSLVGGYVDTGVGAKHVAEDWDFWLRIAAEGARLRNISNEPLFNYRIHQGGSLSSSAGVPAIAAQRREILRRNSRVLGRDRQRTSARQAARRLVANRAGGALADAMLRRGPGKGGRTVIVALPFLLIGGAERLLSSVTRLLAEKGWRVVLLTSMRQDPTHGDSIDWFSSHCREIYRLPAFLDPSEWQDFIEYLIDTRCPDCLLSAGSRFVYEMLPRLRELCPSMAAVDLLFNTTGHVQSHREFQRYFSFALAENSQVLDWLAESGWDRERLRRVRSGVDLELYAPRPRSAHLSGALEIREDDLVVGYSGRLSEEKGPDLFVEIARACESVPGLRFVMTGAGPLKGLVERMAKRLPRSVRFDFMGEVEDVEEFLSLYDLLVLPSRLDGRPLVVMEALSMGIPVVASRVGGLPELVHDGENGWLCDASEPKQFARRIIEIATDRGRLDAMKRVARRYAVDELGAERMGIEYEDALIRAIELHRSAGSFGSGDVMRAMRSGNHGEQGAQQYAS